MGSAGGTILTPSVGHVLQFDHCSVDHLREARHLVHRLRSTSLQLAGNHHGLQIRAGQPTATTTSYLKVFIDGDMMTNHYEIVNWTEDDLSHDAPGVSEQFWWPLQSN